MTMAQRRLPERDSFANFARSALRYFDRAAWACPSCRAQNGVQNYEHVSHKAMVTVLVRRQSCRLLHRAPRDPPDFGDRYYQSDCVSGGLATTLRSDDELCRPADRTRISRSKVRVPEAAGVSAGARILDFGASWGRTTWQLHRAG